MSKTLNVFYKDKIVGQLVQDKHGEMSFTYSKDWLEDKDNFAISCSLPLQSEMFKRNKCRAFFEGLLPEEDQRRKIAKNLSISEKNNFSMLERIGGECAGALTFLSEGIQLNDNDSEYREIANSELVSVIGELSKKPLLAGERGVRLSLAGVQNKLAIYVGDDGKLSIPLYNSPSTHILKPEHDLYEDLIFNEYFCLKLAKQVGVEVADVEMNRIDNINYLLIKRYDRINRIEGERTTIERLHQEDFCQALGKPPTNKYQSEDGPSLQDCFRLIREKSSVPVIDLEKLLDAIMFNYLIGNCDAHGKNFSILYNHGIKLAPLYDLVCTIMYPELEKKMAMKIGGEYGIDKITPTNFDNFSTEIGFSKPEVRKRILKFCEMIISLLQQVEIIHDEQNKIAALIKARCEKLSMELSQRTVKRR